MPYIIKAKSKTSKKWQPWVTAKTAKSRDKKLKYHRKEFPGLKFMAQKVKKLPRYK